MAIASSLPADPVQLNGEVRPRRAERNQNAQPSEKLKVNMAQVDNG